MLNAVIYENEMDIPNIEGFQAKRDCKLTYRNKNQTQLTLVWHIQFHVQKKNVEQNKNDVKNIAKLA